MRKLVYLFVLLLISISGMAADYYWVAGSGTWSNLNNWRLGSPTGSIPSIVPSSVDNVIFGPPGGQAGNWVVTVDANVFCNNFTWLPGLPGTPRINRSNNSYLISVSGNVSIRPNVAYDGIALDLVGSANTTVMANGPANVNMAYNIRKAVGSVVTFADDYIVNSPGFSGNNIMLYTGGLNVANRKITVYSIGSDQAGTRTIDITNATLNLVLGWSAVNTGLTLSATGSIINTNRFFADAGVYHKATISSTVSSNQIVSNCKFDVLEFTNPAVTSEARIASNNIIDTLIFHGWGAVRANSNEVKYLLFKNGGGFGGTGNKVQYTEVNGAFLVIENGTHTLDTLITAPNKNITMSGTLNINKLFRAGGPPCNGFTEVVGNTAGTFNFATGAVVDIDNVLLRNMTATGTMTPLTVNGIDDDGNAGWNIVQPSGPGTTLYWVGGAGDWNDNTHWSTSSGGPGGACIPFINDNVVFDGGSGFSGASRIVTTSGNGYCKDMTWSGVAGNPIFNESGSFNMQVYGSLVMDPTVTMNAALDMRGEQSATVTTNGAGLGVLHIVVRKYLSGTPLTVKFTDDWINPTGTIGLSRGTLDISNLDMNFGGVTGAGSHSRAINMENSNLVAHSWFYYGSSFALNATNSFLRVTTNIATRSSVYNDVEIGTSNGDNIDVANTTFARLTMTSNSLSGNTKISGGNTIRRLEFMGRGMIRYTGNNIDSLILAPSRNFFFYEAANTTVNKYFKAQHPSCSGLGEIRSGTTAISNITFGANAVVEIDNVYLENISASGGGGSLTLPVPFSGADAGGNSGWTINSAAGGARYWVGGSGDWNDAGHWSNTSGGAGGACIPTTSNDVFFDANSGFTAASRTVSISVGNAYFHNMDWTGAVNNPILDKNSAWVAECWGGLVLNPASFINGQLRMMGVENVTISGSTKGNFDLDVRKITGSGITLLNDFANANSNIRLTTGNFNMAGRTVTLTSISNFGNDNNIHLDISGASITATNFQYYGGLVNKTINAANSRITGSVILNGGTYNYISIPGTQAGHCQISNITADSVVFTNPHNASAVGVNGSNNNLNYVEYKGSGGIYGTNNTFGTLVFFPGNVYRLNGGSTNTITGEWFGSGTPCRLTEIRSSTTAQATIVKTSGDVIFDYVRLERSNATGGATFRAKEHSDNLGGNTGWTIDPKDAAAPILGLGADLELCASAFPYTLNTDGFFGAPGSVYTWSNGSTGETLSATAPGTYRVSVTFPDGCNVKDTIKLTQAVVPVDPIVGDAGVCLGETKTLTNVTPGGVWTTSDAAVATVNATGVVTGVAAGNATITYTVTSGAGCVNSVTHALTVNALPVVAAITGTPDVCINGTTPLANTTAGGTWTSSNTGVATVSATGVVTGVAAGTTIITYEVTNAAGCKSAQTINITVNALPVLTAITGTNSACVGGNTTLANATAGGTWVSDNIAIASVDASGSVTGISAGTAQITYTVMNAAGCAASVTAAITVNAPPVMTPVTGTTTLCTGGTTALANATAGGTWSSSSTAVATISAAGVVTGVTAGTATISYTINHAGGCVTTATALVTVSAPPAVGPVTGITTLCVGSTTTLASSTAGGTWSSSNTAVATINAAGAVTGVTAGTSTITYSFTNASGCTATQTAVVTVNALPVVGPITGTNAICVGDATQLASATPGGVWSSSNPAVANVNATGLVTSIMQGTTVISYKVTNASGCEITRTTTVTVNTPLLVAPITGNNTVCTGGAITLSSLTTGGTWSSGSPAIATIDAATGEVTGLTPGTTLITYLVSNSASCNASVTYSVTVHSPTAVAPITGTTDVCIGATTQLANTTAGGAWSSSNTAVATIDATGEVTAISAGIATISYTLTEPSGCVSTQTTSVTVNALPVLAPITGTTSVCTGDAITLSNTTAGGSWSSSNTAVATINAAGEVTGVSAGTATITYTYTNANSCVATVTAAVTVNALPVVNPVTGTTDVCIGSNTTLASTTAGGAWSSSNTAVAPIDAAGEVTGVSAGTTTITYTVTNAAGCVATRTATVTVNALPVLTPVTGTTNVCIAATTTLANSTAGGTWSSSNLAVATIDATGVVTGVTAGTSVITYTFTNAAGCVAAQTTTVTVNARPVVNPILGITGVCIGETTTLSNATSGGTWSTSNAAVATIDAAGEVTGVTAGTATITYTVTNAAGCISMQTTTVTVNSLPVVNPIMGTTTMCVGATTTLASTTAGGTWSSSNTLVATINAAGEVTGVSGGTAVITYTFTNASGCVSAQTATVTVGALPAVDPITGTTDVCIGSVTTLASTTAGGTWSSSDAAVATINAAGEVTGVSGGTATITYTVTNAGGCVEVQTTTVTVNALPVADPITGTTDMCLGFTTTLASTTPGGTWSSSNTAVAAIDAAGEMTGVSAGTATITYMVTNAAGCIATQTATVTVNALPVVDPVTGATDMCIGSNTTLASTTAGGTWYSSNTAVATINAAGLVTGVSDGTTTITYTVTNAAGCVDAVTATVTVEALPVVGPITGTTDVCIGSTTTLASTTAGGAWSSSNTAVATIDAAGEVAGVTAGTATITYTFTNAAGCVAIQTATVTVNALPVVAPITGTSTICIGSTTTLANTTAGGTWTTSNPAIATVDAAGVVTGLSAGTATITYEVNNGGGCIARQTAIITVNDCTPLVPPVAADDQAATYAGQSIVIPVAGNDRQDNGAINIASITITTMPANGTVTVMPDGTVMYAPAEGFSGTDRFNYTIRNTANVVSNIAAVTIRIDEQPVAVNDTLSARTGDRITIPVLVNDRGTLNPASIIITQQPARGTVTINADGTITFSPLPGFKGGEEFRYRVRDVNGTLSNEAVVRLYVGEEDFFIPNAITPNGDGINDRFVIPDQQKLNGSSLTIFNRWGNEVYHKAPYDNRWDGTGLSGGTYYYILRVDLPQGPKVIKGWIQLLK